MLILTLSDIILNGTELNQYWSEVWTPISIQLYIISGCRSIISCYIVLQIKYVTNVRLFTCICQIWTFLEGQPIHTYFFFKSTQSVVWSIDYRTLKNIFLKVRCWDMHDPKFNSLPKCFSYCFIFFLSLLQQCNHLMYVLDLILRFVKMGWWKWSYMTLKTTMMSLISKKSWPV